MADLPCTIKALRAIVAADAAFDEDAESVASLAMHRHRRTLLALVAALRDHIAQQGHPHGSGRYPDKCRACELLALCDGAGITQGERRG